MCVILIYILANPLLETELFNGGQKRLILECIPKGSIERILACMDREKSLTNNTYKLLPGSARDTTALHDCIQVKTQQNHTEILAKSV